MISRMITTVIATAPMFFTISVMVNSLPVDDPAAGLGEACRKNRRKPIAFVPRMVVRIVTVNPPQIYLQLISYRQMRRSAEGPTLSWGAPAHRLLYCATKL